jgi:two-component system, sensor histidine kinase PdtaS
MSPPRLSIRSLILRSVPAPIKWSTTFGVVATAYFLRAKVFTTLPPLPLLFFLPAILFSASFFGLGFGLLATALSGAAAAYFFMPPLGSFAIASPNAGLSLTLFLLTGLLISLMGSALRNAYRDAERLQRATAAAYVQANEARLRAEAGEQERALLLVEFGHRVKNDMQRTIATLGLKAAHSSEPVSAALKEAANQINVVASMHDRLAHRDGDVAVAMHDYLKDLVQGLSLTLADTRPIRLFLDAQPHTLSLDVAGPVGLITNELVTNALKHGFPDNRAGSITISFIRDQAGYCLTVADDGVGMPANEPGPEAKPRQKSLGRKLTMALAAQLGGRLESSAGETGGTVNRLFFNA